MPRHYGPHWTFKQFDAYLGKKDDRPIPPDFGSPRASRVTRLNDHTIAIKYHNTIVVTLHRDNTYTLNTGTWPTFATIRRINMFSPADIGRKDHVLYLLGVPVFDCPVPLVDHVRVASDGSLLNYDLQQAQQNPMTFISGWDRAARV